MDWAVRSRVFLTLAAIFFGGALCSAASLQKGEQQGTSAEPQVVSFPSGRLTLRGVLYKPSGSGPFPAVLYNHGSGRGLLSNQAFARLGPLYVRHGWVFFAPYRRGQGYSQSAGPYILKEIHAAEKTGGMAAGAATMIRLLRTEQLDDQLAGLRWLRAQPYVKKESVAVAGNSFGGIETVLGAEHADYCAAVDGSGGAESWALAPALQTLMIDAVKNSRAPIFFFQAKNDYNLAPSRVLAAAMREAGKVAVVRIYPAYGTATWQGHNFAWRGGSVWGNDVFHFLSLHCGAPSK